MLLVVGDRRTLTEAEDVLDTSRRVKEATSTREVRLAM
jgi:hypothetical protein